MAREAPLPHCAKIIFSEQILFVTCTKQFTSMIFRRILATLLVMVAALCSCRAGADGPYVFYREDGSVRVVTVGTDGSVKDEIRDDISTGSFSRAMG